MNKLFLPLLAVVGMMFIACEGGLDNEDNGGNPSTPKIELSKQTIEVEFESGTYTVSVTSPYSWDAVSKNSWIVIETETGIAGTKELSFKVERNEDEKVREGTILLTNSAFNLAAELYVVQKAFVPEISIEVETLNFAVEGGVQDVAITANFEYEVKVSAEWLTCAKNENGIAVTASYYVGVEERTADITISSKKDYGISKTVTVLQNGLSEEEYVKYIILYTSSDDQIVTPYKTDVFSANIVSITYEKGQGVIKFDAPVTSIGDYTFYGCSSLTSVTIPDSVTSIGEFAFRNCSSLTNITIPDSVTSIGKAAFYDCTSLSIIAIGNGVTSIGAEAFSGCISLANATIPDSVTLIGAAVFCYCPSLKAIYGKFASLDNRCLIFNGELNSFAPAGLKEYTIPDSVTAIGSVVFWGYTSLTSVTIPNSVTSIGSRAFYGCSSLTSVYCKPTTPPSADSSMFSGSASGCKIYVPRQSIEAYKATSGWNYFASDIEGYDFEN